MEYLKNIFFILHKYYPLFIVGIKNTIFIWLCASIISFFIGITWGVLREKRIINNAMSFLFNYTAYLLISTPLYIQLLISTFVIFPFFGIKHILIIGISTLGICSAAYTSQITHTSLSSVSNDQWELARMLGYSKTQKLIKIIFPQAFPQFLPLFINEIDQILKSVSLLSTIGIMDITRASLNIITITFDPIPIYTILLIIYIFLSFFLRYLINKLILKKVTL
jgi:ABC-type amino acid transport system permease subunit